MTEFIRELTRMRLEQVFLLLAILSFPLDLLVPLSQTEAHVATTGEGLTLNKVFAAAAILTFVARALVEKNPDLFRTLFANPAALFAIGYLTIATMSMAFAADPGRAAAGVFQRLTVFGMYYLVVNTVRSRAVLWIMVVALMLSGLVSALAGAYEIVFQESLLEQTAAPGSVAASEALMLSTAGNIRVKGLSPDPDTHAAGLLIVMGLTQALIFTGDWRLRCLSLATVLLMIVNCIATGSRAAWLGLFVALGCFFYFVEIPRKRLLAAIGIGLVLAAFLVMIVAFPDVAVWERLGLGGGESSGSGSFRFRVEMIRVSLEMAVKHPLLGVGTENFLTVYSRYHRVSDFLPKAEPLVPHNIFFGVLAENGILGFVCYLGLMLAVAWESFQNMRRAPDHSFHVLALGIFTAHVCYLYTQNIYPVQGFKYGWVVMGFSAAMANILRDEEPVHDPLSEAVDAGQWKV